MCRVSSELAVGLLCLLTVTGVGAAQPGGLGVTATAEETRAGGTVMVTFAVENTGSESRPAIVNMTELPAGWGIENRTDDGGRWNDGDRSWLFTSIPPGGSVTPGLTVSVPTNASGNYDVVATVQDDDTTSRVTATVTVGDGATERTATGTGTVRETTSGNGPGVGVLGAVAVLVGATLLVWRRS